MGGQILLWEQFQVFHILSAQKQLLEYVGKDLTINGYVSIDKLTNEIVVLNAEKVRIPDELCGVKVSDENRQKLKNGEAVYFDNLISKEKKTFSRHCVALRYVVHSPVSCARSSLAYGYFMQEGHDF